MPVVKYTDEQTQWLKENRANYTLNELMQMFNKKFNTDRDLYSIKNCLRRHNISVEQHESYTKEQDEWLKQNVFSYTNYDDVSRDFNNLFGTNKSNRGIQSHCVRYLNIISNRQSKPPFAHNKKDIGSESYANGYALIKINNTGNKKKDWITKQRYIYQQHYGKIADDEIVIFLDGDKTNFAIDNLKAIKRSINAKMNQNSWTAHNKDFMLTAIKWCELLYAMKGVEDGSTNKILQQ